MAVRSVLWLTAAMLLTGPKLNAAETTCSSQLSPDQIHARLTRLIASMTVPERIAQLQDRAPAIPRLGLAAYNWWNEGLHGLARDGYATVFPQAIGLAATWDASLLHDVGEVVSTEARAKFNGHGREAAPRYGGLTLWSPNINIFRDPRWGRGQETYGEDPTLTGSLGAAFVRGVQGTDPFYLRADATPKHFAAHSGPEKGRDSFNAVTSPHDLADTYLRAFHTLTVDAHAAAMMCSYNEINGVPSCANESTLKQTVREQWGFQGYVVSDCDAVGDIAEYHHFAKDDAHGAALALQAGTDLDCGTTYAALQQALTQGLVTETQIDQALYRLLMARVKLGMLDPLGCTPYDQLGPEQIDSLSHRALALRASEESMVLLRNEGVLPLKNDVHLAVIGPTADMVKVLEANYHGTALRPQTPLVGIQHVFRNVRYAQGSLLAEGIAAPIPRSALQLTMGGKAGSGLKAEYFDSPSVHGAPVGEETIAKVDLDLNRVGPGASIKSPHYAVRWSGYLQPPAPGDYTLHVNVERCWDCTAHDAFRLYLDDQLVLSSDGSKSDPGSAVLHAEGTAMHALRLELDHKGDDEGIGLEWVPPANVLLDEARKTASNAGVIVAALGLSPDLEGEALKLEVPGFDGGDRTSLELPLAQQTLLRELVGTGKPVVVLLTSGSAVTLGTQPKAPAAVLEAWYPGEEGGDAIANLLSGAANPSGRLPVTFYRSAKDLPAFADYSMGHRTYRYFDQPVLYRFGDGLSYSRFTYTAPTLSAPSISAGAPLTVRVKLANSGPIAGTEVTEVYLQPPATPGSPRLQLVGFLRNHLGPGEQAELAYTVDATQMSTVDLSGRRRVQPGIYRLFIGAHQPVLNDTGGLSFTISGEKPMAF